MVKYPWSGGESLGRGWWSYIRRHLPGISIAAMVVLLIGFVLYPYTLITVPSGNAGVLWKRFSGPGIYCWCILPSGTVLDPDEIRHEGLHFIWPWDKLFLYNLRLQSSTQKFNAISSDGVNVTAEIIIRYQLNFSSAAVLHQFIGPGYLNTVLIPEIGSVTRAIIAKYKAEEVYSSKRQQIQDEIRNTALTSLADHLDSLFQAQASVQASPTNYENFLQHAIMILDTPVLSIELPTDIVSAINQKIEQYYKIQEFQYRAEREVEESKRKQIEANGIAAFQQTVTQGISDSYLRWQGIQATLALAQSQNTKIIIIGNGKDGLPVILGNLDSTPTPNSSQNTTGGNTQNTTGGNTPGNTQNTTGGNTPGNTQNTTGGNTPGNTQNTTGGNTPGNTQNTTGGNTPDDIKPRASLDLTDFKSIISQLSNILGARNSEKNMTLGKNSRTDKTTK